MANIYETFDAADPAAAAPPPPSAETAAAPKNTYEQLDKQDQKQYGFLPNAGASAERIVSGTMGLAPDLVNATTSAVNHSIQKAQSADTQGLTPAGFNEYGLPTYYTDKNGKTVDPDMTGIKSDVKVMPGSKDIQDAISARVKQDTGFDASRVGQRPLGQGGVVDYAGAAVPYLASLAFGGVARGVADGYELAPLAVRAGQQALRSGADAGITSFVTTPGSIEERAKEAAVAAGVGAPVGALSSVAVSAARRALQPSVEVIGQNGEKMKVPARSVALAGKELGDTLGEADTATVAGMPSANPDIPGYQSTLAQSLPNNPNVVSAERTARTTDKGAFQNIADSQTAAIKDANTGISEGGNAADVGNRLGNVRQTAIESQQKIVDAQSKMYDFTANDFNARVQRYKNPSGTDPRLPVDGNGKVDLNNLDLNAWKTANPDLANNGRLKPFLDQLEQDQQQYRSALDNMPGAAQPHVASLIGQDTNSAMDHIFSARSIDPKTGKVIQNSDSRMTQLLDEINKPATSNTSSWTVGPNGTRFGPPAQVTQQDAQGGVKKLVTDYISDKFLKTPISATGTSTLDAQGAANLSRFVGEHESALRKSVGDDGYKVLQAISDHLNQQTSVPSSLGISLPPKAAPGLMHGAPTTGVGSAVTALALDHLTDGLTKAIEYASGMSPGMAVAGATVLAAGVGGRVLYNAFKAAGVKTQADLISLAIRYPNTVGKQLLESAPNGLSEGMARSIARSIGAATAQQPDDPNRAKYQIPTMTVRPSTQPSVGSLDTR